METTILQISYDNIDAEKIRLAAKNIDSGGLVAFPTETVYGIACRVENNSIEKLNQVKGRPPEKPYSLHIGNKNIITEYVPVIGLRAKKIIEQFWPGPLTIIFELTQNQIETQKQKLNIDVFENLYKNNAIGIRLPDDKIAQLLLNSTAFPVVAPSANISDMPPAVDSETVIKDFNGKIDVIINAGVTKYKKSSTIIKISQFDLNILRQGFYTAEQVISTAAVKILFVCSGNTCRSPIACGFAKKYLAEKIGCPIDRIEEKGYKILSAGTLGFAGAAATIEAINACRKKGVDITGHRSQALSQAIIEQSDLIFVMTRMHLHQILDNFPNASDKCKLLVDNFDVPDPIGQSQNVYDNTAELIEKAVKRRIDELNL